jgi:hypothetical protein
MRMTSRKLWWSLLGVGVAAAAGFAVIVATRDAHGQSQLWSELARGFIGLALAGVLGTMLKLLADAYQARRQVAERRAEFRADKYRRVVEATNALRKAGTLINANRSVKTWSEQMLELVDASNALRLVKHEIALSSEGVSDPPFRDHAEVVRLLTTMYRYLEMETEHFADDKLELSELQRRAESLGSDTERTTLQDEIWDKIKSSVSSLLATPRVEDIRAATTSLENDRPSESGDSSRVTYEAAEELVLRRIAQAALETTRVRQSRS